jgi:hypothetical protein
MIADARPIHDPPHPAGQRRNVVEQGQWRKVVGPADIVSTPRTGADENAAVGAHSGLTDLHIDALVMQRDFAGHGNAGKIGAQIAG